MTDERPPDAGRGLLAGGYSPSRTTKSLLFWASVAITVLFSYLAVRHVRFGDVWHALGASNYLWLLPALATLALAIFMRAVRWRALFAPETRPPLGAVTSALLVGYLFNNILPARAGEAARVIALYQRTGTSRPETLATVLIERVYDVLSLLVLFFAASPWLPEVSWFRSATELAIALSLAIGAAMIVLAVWGDRPLRFALRPVLYRLPAITKERADHAMHRAAEGFAGLRRARVALSALFWTFASWLVMSISFWLVMLAFHLGLSPAAGLLVVITTGLAMVIPSAAAAVGVFEAATLVGLRSYGISDSRALSYALILHVVNFLPYVVVGVLILQLHASALRRRGGATGAES